MYVSKAIQGDLEIKFQHPLEVVGCDEFNLFLSDPTRRIGGLPYITIISKEWGFVDALTGCTVGFEIGID